MKRYLAIYEEGNYGIYLSSSEQMDHYLQNGFHIYEEEYGKDDLKRTLIATPKDGFLYERPELPYTTKNTRR